MQVRKMTQRDLPQYRELCRYAFGLTPEHAARYARTKKEYDHTFGVFDRAKLAAGLWYYPFDMRVGPEYVPMGGISMVATWPEYRNRGLIKKLMIHVHEYMKKSGCCTAVLFPFKYSFYERMGYGLACEFLLCQFDPGQIRAFPAEGYRVEEVDGAKSWRAMEDIHQQARLEYNGTVKRDLNYWKRRYFTHFRLPVHVYLVSRGKTPVGFVITLPEEPQEFPKSKMSVRDAAWIEPGAGRAVFNFLRSHSDQIKTVRMLLPNNMDLFRYFDAPRVEAKLEPKMMFKLIDARTAVEKRAYPGMVHGRLGLNLQGDETSRWNTGQYEISFADARARMIRLKSRRKTGSKVNVSINAFSQLYFGYYSVDDLLEMNAIAGPEGSLEILAEAFPKSPTYLHDWF